MMRIRQRIVHRFVYLLAVLAVLFFWLHRGHAALLLILLLLLAYGAAAWLMVRLSGLRLDCQILGGGLSDHGDPLTMDVHIMNRSHLPILRGLLELAALNRLTGQSLEHTLRVTLGPGAAHREQLELTDRYCGEIELTTRHMLIMDPLGLFIAERAAEGRAAGYIAPQLSPVQIPEDYLDSYNMESYQYSQYEKGSDPGEVFGIREYQEGDSLKQIHWKLTAKLGTMTVKIPSFPIENNILILLDNLLVPGQTAGPSLDLRRRGRGPGLFRQQKDPQRQAWQAADSWSEEESRRRSRLVEQFCSLSAALLDKGIPHSIAFYHTGEQVLYLRRIQDQAGLQQSMPEILGCGFEESEVSIVYRYLESQEGVGFTNHFLVSFQEERDVERLENYGAVKVFRETE